jgi:hypothetical protein
VKGEFVLVEVSFEISEKLLRWKLLIAVAKEAFKGIQGKFSRVARVTLHLLVGDIRQ